MSFSEVCAWVWPPQFVPCSQTSGHEEGCQDTGVCCFRLFLLLNLTLNSDPANASLSIPLHPPPPSVYFPGECADSLPFGAEFPEAGHLGEEFQKWAVAGSAPTC